LKKPNFFIVGAPKCGTTALSEYLRSHPNIFVSSPKEPHFFADDFPKQKRIYNITTLDDYMALFAEAGDEHLAVGEASVWYLYSSVAIRNIYQLNRDARLIVMLRNPVDMVYSLHSEFLHSFYEDEPDFRKAWNLQFVDRINGYFTAKYYVEPAFLEYGRVARFGDQVERLFSTFPREHVHVILFDDFVASTQAVYEEVLSFLGVPSDGRKEFPRINVSKAYRMVWIADLTKPPPEKILYLARKVRDYWGIDLGWITRTLRRFNTKKKTRKPLSRDFREELVRYFEEDIEKLSHIIDRDLADWLD
jgi:hypothetical protein